MDEGEKRFNKEYRLQYISEGKCPKCDYDMKEGVNRYRCRNLDCRFIIEKEQSDG